MRYVSSASDPFVRFELLGVEGSQVIASRTQTLFNDRHPTWPDHVQLRLPAGSRAALTQKVLRAVRIYRGCPESLTENRSTRRFDTAWSRYTLIQVACLIHVDCPTTWPASPRTWQARLSVILSDKDLKDADDVLGQAEIGLNLTDGLPGEPRTFLLNGAEGHHDVRATPRANQMEVPPYHPYSPQEPHATKRHTTVRIEPQSSSRIVPKRRPHSAPLPPHLAQFPLIFAAELCNFVSAPAVLRLHSIRIHDLPTAAAAEAGTGHGAAARVVEVREPYLSFRLLEAMIGSDGRCQQVADGRYHVVRGGGEGVWLVARRQRV